MTVNLGERHVQVVAIHRQIGRQRGGGSVFHELGVERAADDHGGEAVFVNQLGQRQRGLRQPVTAQAGNDIDHVRRSRLQPERKFQTPSRRRNQHRPGLAVAGKFRVFESEENRFEGFQRGGVRFSLHLKIRHPVLPRKSPGVLNLGIGVHFGLAETHIFAHAVGKIIIHVRVSEITVGAEISQWIVRDEVVGRDVKQRVGGGVGGQTDSVAFVARPENREHDETLRLPTPLAEGLAKIGV